MRKCIAHGCSIQVDCSLLMCAAHWRKVPATIQKEVYATLKVYKKTGPSTPDADFRAARQNYYGAVDKAFRSVGIA